MKGFVGFIKKQGVVGLAIGFVLAGAVTKLVAALVEDIINPLLGVALSNVKNLQDATFTIWGAVIKWGNFISVLIDFFIIALVVYVAYKLLKLEESDKK